MYPAQMRLEFQHAAFVMFCSFAEMLMHWFIVWSHILVCHVLWFIPIIQWLTCKWYPSSQHSIQKEPAQQRFKISNYDVKKHVPGHTCQFLCVFNVEIGLGPPFINFSSQNFAPNVHQHNNGQSFGRWKWPKTARQAFQSVQSWGAGKQSGSKSCTN